MKKFAVIIALFSSLSAFAGEQCYQVSTYQDSWSKTPELLCVNEDTENNIAAITLKSGLAFNQQTVATFNLNLLLRAKCLGCNKDVFGLANPSNSSFNDLSIKFDGTIDVASMKEEGTVSIGATTFYYRSLRK